jgi:RNA-directed DNA polymerase
MQRSAIGLEDIVAWDNLAAAFHAAARGKRGRGDVEAFRANLEHELAALREGVLGGTLAPGPMRAFRIHDPKPRLIHAPCFRDRVLHHAIMARVGPVLDRALVFDTYACRTGKGTLAAVRRAQQHARRYEWFGQIDVRAYFASIDHDVLLGLLARKFKDRDLLALLARIVRAHAASAGRGLPIGTLTSQHFANFYLDGLDRCLLEHCRVGGFVRYMDDVVWWTDHRTAARAACEAARTCLAEALRLEVRQPVRIGRSRDGLGFCGFRILPARLKLSRRRKQRYARLRKAAEWAALNGLLDARGLQSAYATHGPRGCRGVAARTVAAASAGGRGRRRIGGYGASPSNSSSVAGQASGKGNGGWPPSVSGSARSA